MGGGLACGPGHTGRGRASHALDLKGLVMAPRRQSGRYGDEQYDTSSVSVTRLSRLCHTTAAVGVRKTRKHTRTHPGMGTAHAFPPLLEGHKTGAASVHPYNST